MADEHASKEAEVSLSLPRGDWGWLLSYMLVCVADLPADSPARRRIEHIEGCLTQQFQRHKATQAVGTAKKPFQECPQCNGSRLEKFCEAIPCTKCDGTGFYPA